MSCDRGTPDVLASTIVADPTRVAAVDAEDLRRLLTTIIRGDRFVRRAMSSGQAFESGMLLAIARRAETLLAIGP